MFCFCLGVSLLCDITFSFSLSPFSSAAMKLFSSHEAMRRRVSLVLQYGIRAGSWTCYASAKLYILPRKCFLASFWRIMDEKPETKLENISQKANIFDLDQSLRPTSLFYLHPGENPGLVLVSNVLNDTNYVSWSKNMQHALLSKNKLKFVNGNIITPLPTDPNYEAWERWNVMILSWIMRTLTPNIAESMMYIDSAKELWDELKERFSQGDYIQISDLFQEIHSIK